VVKNLASSFCKVQEEGLEKRLLRKNKLDSKKKAPGAAMEAPAQGSKLAKGKTQANSSGSSKEKGANATDGVASQAKKRPHK
jgi:hypothetical protein